jgi:hypothetical protein
MMWSMNGFNRLEVFGTEKVCNQSLVLSTGQYTHMRQELFCQGLPFLTFPISIKDYQSPTSLQAVSRHFQFIHRVDILDVTFHTWTVWRSRDPEV